MTNIKLMIADDHKLFREGIKALLAVTDDIEIIGEAEDGDAALKKSRELEPDVILMDINMPGLNGIRVTEQILEKRPQTRIIMLTMLEDDASIFHAMRAGARGYLLKGADTEEVLSVIRAVAEGQALFGPAIATRLMNYFKELSAKPAVPGTPFPELTEREVEVLRLLAQGCTNQEIADKLFISFHTVESHRANLMFKAGVKNTAGLIRWAVENDFLD